MIEKRFTFTQDTLAKADVFDGDEFVCCTLSVWVEQLVDKLNGLSDENKELKQSQASILRELLIYRKIARCSNCKYQNYDWFDDGDEFEICEKGNNDQQTEYRICKEWEEFE